MIVCKGTLLRPLLRKMRSFCGLLGRNIVNICSSANCTVLTSLVLFNSYFERLNLLAISRTQMFYKLYSVATCSFTASLSQWKNFENRLKITELPPWVWCLLFGTQCTWSMQKNPLKFVENNYRNKFLGLRYFLITYFIGVCFNCTLVDVNLRFTSSQWPGCNVRKFKHKVMSTMTLGNCAAVTCLERLDISWSVVAVVIIFVRWRYCRSPRRRRCN